MNGKSLNKAADILLASNYTIAFTGAGISVESGIPPFRGEGGIWDKFNPEVLDIDYFYAHPKESWSAIREIFYGYFANAKPNKAHQVLAKMEKAGKLKAIVTQNIDNLHQEAGSGLVYEFHGNSKKVVCTDCGRVFPAHEIDLSIPVPQCMDCGNLLKPDFVFFGEQIPGYAHTRSLLEASRAEAVLVVGTMGEVVPANLIPITAKQHGAKIVEINTEPSAITNTLTDIFIMGKAAEVFGSLEKLIFK